MKLTKPISIEIEQLQRETSMQEKDGSSNDEVQVEINRMRNSLNALTLKNFMFDVKNEGEEEILGMEVKEIASSDEQPQPVTFKRNTSKHRQDPIRTQSGIFNQDDIIKALTESQEKLSQTESQVSVKQKQKVKFADVHETDNRPKMFKDSSRESDEVATINELPWQKKNRGYKTVTPFFKPKSNIKALSNENIADEQPKSFRPIKSSHSIEDINKQIVRPVPLLASKSYQELPTKFEPFDDFRTKSSDDLLLDNIDGVRKITESKTHRLLRIRSTSSDRLDRSNDQLVYENFNYEIPLSADNVALRTKKKPMPQPRLSADVNELKKRESKTVVYVLDKEKDEFVLQPSEIDDAYESVLVQNNVDAYRDSDYFKYLLNSREDCKLCAYTSHVTIYVHYSHKKCKKKYSGAFIIHNTHLRIRNT